MWLPIRVGRSPCMRRLGVRCPLWGWPLSEDAFGVSGRAALWLVQPPPGLSPPVWDVVCLAALSAMDLGRQRVVMAGLAAGATLPGATVSAVGAAVVADLWGPDARDVADSPAWLGRGAW